MPRPWIRRPKDPGGLCPICGEPRRRYRKTCSKACSSILKSRTISLMYADGSLDFLKKIQARSGRENIKKAIEHNRTQEGRDQMVAACIKRNKIHGNPATKEEVRNKISATRKERLKSGRIKNPMSDPAVAARAGKLRKAAYDSGEKIHPMKNPELAKQVSRSLKEAYASGRIGEPIRLNSNRYYRGWYANNQGLWQYYASGWELTRMEFLDSCPEITWKKLTSEYRIPYIDPNGVKRTYFPDFEIRFHDKIIIEEIGTFTEGKQCKIKTATEYFEDRPEIYVALGGNQLNEKTW